MHNLTQEELLADRELYAISTSVTLTLRVGNYQEEKRAFLAGSKENPEFQYKEPMRDAHYLMEKINKIVFPETPLGQLLAERSRELASIIAFTDAKDAAAATRASIEIYGKPTDEHIASANKITAQGAKEKHAELKLDSAQVVRRLEDALKSYGLTSWRVESSHDISQGIAVHSQGKKVHVQKTTTSSLEELEMMVTHEIETHVLTSENAESQPIKLLYLGLTGWLRTQEGLAAYNVVTQHPEGSARPLFHWAARTIAVRAALQGSFRDVFNMLKEIGFNDEYAFAMTFKVKRGLPNVAEPGAYTRDFVYFAGLHDVQEFVAGGGKLQDLYVGRLSLSMLPMLKKVKGMLTAKYLPRFLQ